ncbi:hypothetical protein [Mucilaginibacter sp.]|uniref:hypothetical protein n=1 Tax=Mucilaginibacter sp. TaxID=1882438 RepID=UPI00284F0739|nr:hypothetical protein [Mucilaginibacter sp.]MDR3694385.1 hypothetical protein [Mucilaginibacter sp.]
MKQKEVFKKIGGIIQELSDQYEYLKTVPDDLNDLELELFVANAHFLTDHIEVLCKLNLQNRPKRVLEKPEKPEKPERPEKPEIAYEQKYFEPVVQQMKHGLDKDEDKNGKETFKVAEPEDTHGGKVAEKSKKEAAKNVESETSDGKQPENNEAPEIDLTAAAPADIYSFRREEPETIRHELILDETMDLDEDESLEIEAEPVKEPKKRKFISPFAEKTADEEAVAEIGDEKQFEIKPEPSEVSQHAGDEILTINQKMSSQLGEKGIAHAEQLSIKPISDIKLAITLNDKLLYVKDLFNGYNLAYSEAIEILNRFNTFEEATRFLKTNYVSKNNWESKPATTEKFYALLKRRYA